MSDPHTPPPHRPYTLRLLATALLAQALLLLWAWGFDGRELALYDGQDAWLRVRSPQWDKLVAFAPKGPTAADSALQNLLAADLDTAPPPPDRKLPPPNWRDTASLDYKIRIENPAREDGRYALDAFFEALAAVEAGDSAHGGDELVRIAHYGDSQIEGDRITLFLRRAFQRRFGGSGLGWVPLLEPASHHSLSRTLSTNWRRYTVFQNRSRQPYYGMGGVVFRYGPGTKPEPSVTRDSSRTGAAAAGGALPGSILVVDLAGLQDTAAAAAGTDTARKPKRPAVPDESFRPARGPAGSARLGIVRITPQRGLRYERLSLLWGQAEAPFRVSLRKGDSLVWSDSLPARAQFTRTRIPNVRGAEKFELRFEGPSPEVYGLLMDGAGGGVAVDNFGLRGHSGNYLSRIDGAYLAQQTALLHTRLIIFQYGGNIVPYEVKSFQFLEDDVYRMVRRYQQLAPQASILVVGVGDMARKVGEEYHSYPSVARIRDAQRRAAQRAGVAFWDLYQVMGGADAIVSWVNAKPPLAAADYAHFSYPGQKLVGDLLFKALMNEYALYLSRKQRSTTRLSPTDTGS